MDTRTIGKYLLWMAKDKVAVAVAQRIRRRREEMSFSQEGFADHINFDRSNYGAIERGERNISVRTLARIAKGLETDPGTLLPELSEINNLL